MLAELTKTTEKVTDWIPQSLQIQHHLRHQIPCPFKFSSAFYKQTVYLLLLIHAILKLKNPGYLIILVPIIVCKFQQFGNPYPFFPLHHTRPSVVASWPSTASSNTNTNINANTNLINLNCNNKMTKPHLYLTKCTVCREIKVTACCIRQQSAI